MDKIKSLIEKIPEGKTVRYFFRCYLPVYTGCYTKIVVEYIFDKTYESNNSENVFLQKVANFMKNAILYYKCSEQIEIKNSKYLLTKEEVQDFLRSLYWFDLNDKDNFFKSMNENKKTLTSTFSTKGS